LRNHRWSATGRRGHDDSGRDRCGDVSVVHFEAIDALDGSELVAVCDVDPDSAARAGERYGVPSFTSHAELLAAMRPDVVHIATPHDQHVQPAIDCLAAGVHAVVEKPVAHTRSEAERLVAAAEQPGAPKIAVCFQNRYNATSQAIVDLLASGELGSVIGGAASVCWSRPAGVLRGPAPGAASCNAAAVAY
jgi:predicted dehydrogenase